MAAVSSVTKPRAAARDVIGDAGRKRYPHHRAFSLCVAARDRPDGSLGVATWRRALTRFKQVLVSRDGTAPCTCVTRLCVDIRYAHAGCNVTVCVVGSFGRYHWCCHWGVSGRIVRGRSGKCGSSSADLLENSGRYVGNVRLVLGVRHGHSL